jgi:uncharacterized membrane protein
LQQTTKGKEMNQIRIAIMASILGIVVVLAHALCFEDTMIGGLLPFFILVGAPILAFWIGHRAGRKDEFEDYINVSRMIIRNK